jgi:hypothetical protein
MKTNKQMDSSTLSFIVTVAVVAVITGIPLMGSLGGSLLRGIDGAARVRALEERQDVRVNMRRYFQDREACGIAHADDPDYVCETAIERSRGLTGWDKMHAAAPEEMDTESKLTTRVMTDDTDDQELFNALQDWQQHMLRRAQRTAVCPAIFDELPGLAALCDRLIEEQQRVGRIGKVLRLLKKEAREQDENAAIRAPSIEKQREMFQKGARPDR